MFHGSSRGVSATAARTLRGGPADSFGISVASAGDVNGDGFSDIIVGADSADPGGRMFAGTASVFHGSPAGVSVSPARVFGGAGSADLFGHSVASAGDVNGDGFADVIIGSELADPGGRTNAGTASIFQGSASGLVASPMRVFEGNTNDGFGVSVSSAGDVNNDGFADIVVGADFARPGGSASVFHGGTAGLPAEAAHVLESVVGGTLFGHSVATAGDVNNDGFSDVLIGAPWATPSGRMLAGTVSVFQGTATGLSTRAVRVLEGVLANDTFGGAVAGAGDLNGDGFADIAVGAEIADPGARVNVGACALFSGSSAGIQELPTRVLEGATEGDLFGHSLARASSTAKPKLEPRDLRSKACTNVASTSRRHNDPHVVVLFSMIGPPTPQITRA